MMAQIQLIHRKFYIYYVNIKQKQHFYDWISSAPQSIFSETGVKRGHEIGNHTMNHLYASNSSDEKLENDILDGKKFFEKWVKEPLLFRPPGGYINDAVFKTAKEAGYQTVLWSWHQDPRDWANPGVESIVNHVVKMLKVAISYCYMMEEMIVVKQ